MQPESLTIVATRNTLPVIFCASAARRLLRLPEAVDGVETTVNATLQNGGTEWSESTWPGVAAC